MQPPIRRDLISSCSRSWMMVVQVTAKLTPVSDSQVDVQFKQFKILGLLPVTAPESAKGSLLVTYLDEEMRISRGDRGTSNPCSPTFLSPVNCLYISKLRMQATSLCY